MHCSVKSPVMNALFFISEVPDNPDGSLVIEEGAWVEVPSNVDLWPEGTRAPEQVLARSREEPKVYKLFKYRNQIDRELWDEVGLDFGGTFNKPTWERFAAKFPALSAVQSITDEDA